MLRLFLLFMKLYYYWSKKNKYKMNIYFKKKNFIYQLIGFFFFSLVFFKVFYLKNKKIWIQINKILGFKIILNKNVLELSFKEVL